MHYEYISILKFDFGNCIKFLIWHNDNMGNDVVEIKDSKILTFDNFETAKKFTGTFTLEKKNDKWIITGIDD